MPTAISTRLTTAAAVLASLAALPSPASAREPDGYIGEVRFLAFDFCPSGTVKANGDVVDIRQYNALYELIGTRYGGDGEQTFAVPDLRREIVSEERGKDVPLIPCVIVNGEFPRR
jgi:hypothetical protein